MSTFVWSDTVRGHRLFWYWWFYFACHPYPIVIETLTKVIFGTIDTSSTLPYFASKTLFLFLLLFHLKGRSNYTDRGWFFVSIIHNPWLSRFTEILIYESKDFHDRPWTSNRVMIFLNHKLLKWSLIVGTYQMSILSVDDVVLLTVDE